MKYYFYKYFIILLILGVEFYIISNNLYFTKDIIPFVFYSFPFFYCFYFLLKRQYVMTEKNLNNFSDDEVLEYEIIYNRSDNTLNKLYVRTISLITVKWYEIDYDLTISKDSTKEKVETFVSQVKTIHDLKCYMEQESKKTSVQASIEYNKTEEKSIFYMTICCFILFYLMMFMYNFSLL